MGTKAYVLLSVILNGVLPWAVYALLSPHMESVEALTIAALVPLADNLLHFRKFRKLDAFGALMLFTFVLTLLLAAAGGGETALLLRESFVTGGVGAVFLASLLLKRPLMYHIAGKFVNTGRFAANTRYAYFRCVMRLMTAVWGSVLVLEAFIRVYLVFRLTTTQFLAVSNVVLYTCIGILILWTAWYRKRSSGRLAQIIALEERSHGHCDLPI